MVISFVPSAIAPELEAVAATKRHNIFHEESGGGGKGYASREGWIRGGANSPSCSERRRIIVARILSAQRKTVLGTP